MGLAGLNAGRWEGCVLSGGLGETPPTRLAGPQRLRAPLAPGPL